MPETLSPKIGDTVHVEFDGVVEELVASGRVAMTLPGKAFRAFAYPEHVTVIASPIAAGDPATLAVLDELPHGSIVTAPDGTIAYLDIRGLHRAWRLPGDDRFFASYSIAGRDLTVVRVGTGAGQ